MLWGRGRIAAKFKRLNLTALADAAGRGGRGRGRAWRRVTWEGRGLASLPFVLPGACAEGGTRGLPPPLGPAPVRSSGASAAGVGYAVWKFSAEPGSVRLSSSDFSFSLFWAVMGLAVELLGMEGVVVVC